MTLLYLPRWMEILITLEGLPDNKRYPQSLYRACPTCSSHTKTILKKLRYYEIIHIDKKGKIRWIQLTPKGQQLSHHLLQIRWTLASIFKENP